jgi:hypothetical protein
MGSIEDASLSIVEKLENYGVQAGSFVKDARWVVSEHRS